MEQTITSENKPIKLWLPDIDADTLQQAKNLANLPGIHHHVALMPDAHVGYGMPIGGVAATEGIVIPNAVGVDIGCGVCAIQTSLAGVREKELKRVMAAIRQQIPLGFKHHRQPQPAALMPAPPAGTTLQELPVVHREYQSGRGQLGTLGGGNHFIEIQRDENGLLWLMVHSGSRNIGYQVAKHYNHAAIDFNARRKSAVPKNWQLAALPVDHQLGRLYLLEMHYCVEFARASRQLMLERVMDILAQLCAPVRFGEILDVPHNYAALERHFGKEVYVHRKGATRAGSGELGIIPGSQGSRSYIVRGLGNADSFSSCSHGAGRRLGRKQAQRELNLQQEIAHLEEQGIIHGLRSRRDLEEAAGAYKDIDEVLARQRDLVETVTALQPLAVIKG